MHVRGFFNFMMSVNSEQNEENSIDLKLLVDKTSQKKKKKCRKLSEQEVKSDKP